MFQMISHGIVSGALFLCVGVVYDRMHTREIAAYGGLVERMPLYAVVFMVFTMANVGLPGTSGFVGEFLTLVGTFKVNIWVATLATLGVILSAAYALWLYRKVVFGKLDKPKLHGIRTWTRARSRCSCRSSCSPSCSASIRSRCSTCRQASVTALVAQYQHAIGAAKTAAALLRTERGAMNRPARSRSARRPCRRSCSRLARWCC